MSNMAHCDAESPVTANLMNDDDARQDLSTQGTVSTDDNTALAVYKV